MDLEYQLTDEDLDAWDAMLLEGEWDGGNYEPLVADQAGAGFDINIGDHLDIIPNGTRKSPKYGLTFKQFKVTTRDLEVPSDQVHEGIVAILNYVLDHVLAEVPDDSYVRLRIDNKVLRQPIWTPPILKSQVTVERWMDVVQRVLQSCETFSLGAGFEVAVHYVEIPSGGCRKEVADHLKRKLNKLQCIIQIQNKDKLCMARALVVGRADADGKKKLCRQLSRKERPAKQTQYAKELIEEAGLPEREYTIADIAKFEAVSVRVSLPVYCLSMLFS
jgi:hypothetical protein